MNTTNHARQRIDGFDCTDLLGRSIAGDREAREELARICLTRVRRTVFFVAGHAQDTDDLVQQAMSRLFVTFESFRGEGSFGAWIDRVTVSVVRSYYRRRPLRLIFRESCPASMTAAPEAESPERIAAGKEAMRGVDRELLHIRPNKRIALVLSAAYGYSMAEIAEIMGCTTETAKKRVWHARSELLARLRSTHDKRHRDHREDEA